MLNQNEGLLQQWIKTSPTKVESFLIIATMITELVHHIHKQNETIGILTPNNIKILLKQNRAVLTEAVKWNDAYRAPEYIGAFNRHPDSRSDLYALGIIFFELLTGQLPFRLVDRDTDWSLIHYVETPYSITMYRPELTGPINDMIEKLLQKSPDLRYQSAIGLLTDLQLCSQHLEQYGEIKPFEIGQLDKISQFSYPDQPIGRNLELTHMMNRFDECTRGATSSIFIAGAEGIGKTFFVHSVISCVTQQHAQVIEGYCRESNSSPFAPIIEAIKMGFDQLWSEDTKKIKLVRDMLERELGSHISYLWFLFPNEAKFLGLFSDEISLLELEPQVIHKILFIMLRSLASYRKPLVLAIDRIELADSETIDFISNLLDQCINGLLCIFTLKTNNMEHYVRKQIEKNRPIHSIEQLQLDSLLYEDIRQLLQTILHEDTMRIRVLARILYDQTNGVPNVIKKTLYEWFESKKLVFNTELKCWDWGALLMDQSSDFMNDTNPLYEAEFERLSEHAQQIIGVASLIGLRFQSSFLAQVMKADEKLIIKYLTEVEQEGMICREDARSEHEPTITYLFMNKRLQRMIKNEQADSTKWHYLVGKSYERLIHEQDYLLETVNHLNRCISMLTNDEKYVLADLNAKAAKLLNKQRKHHEAKKIALIGIELLEQLKEIISKFCPHYIELAYSEYMNKNTEQARTHFNNLMRYSEKLDRKDRIILSMYQLEMYTLENNEEAIRNGVTALKEFGWELPEKVSKTMLLSEVTKTQRALRSLRGHKLPKANQESEYELLSQLISSITFPLFSVDPMKAIVLLSRFIRYGLEHGVNEFVIVNVGIYELILDRGTPVLFKFLRSKTVDLLQEVPLINEIQSYRLPMLNGLVKQLKSPEVMMIYMMKSLRRSIEYGDMTHVNLAIIVLLSSHYGNLYELIELQAYIKNEIIECVDEKTNDFLKWSIEYREAMQDEVKIQSYVLPKKSEEEESLNSYVCLNKLEAAYISGKYEDALIWAQRAEHMIISFDLLPYRKCKWLKGLTLAALYSEASVEKKKAIQQFLSKLLNDMKQWSQYWGRGSSLYLLIYGEWHRIKGKAKAAISYYEQAIQHAKIEKYDLIEAITYEKLFEAYTQSGSITSASIALMDACTAYSSWGLLAKVNQIKTKYPQISWATTMFTDHTNASAKANSENETQEPMRPSKMNQPILEQEQDLLSQMFLWSRTEQNEQSIQRFLEIAISQLGADRGYILFCEEQQCRIGLHVGKAFINDELPTAPEYIARYVNVTDSPLILNDAMSSQYTKDPYISTNQPASLICLPLGRQKGKTDWLVYLENTHIKGVFTERSIQILELMITRITYLHWIKNELKTKNSSKVYKHSMTSFSLDAGISVDSLTHRELDVLNALTAGLSNKEIGESLGISEATVKTHLVNLYSKLGVKRRGQAIAKAKELNLV